jgi:hypothetical protein
MAVIAYEHPVTGATPPTALQAKEQVTFNIIATASAGVTVTATHNMGITSAELALGFPEVILEPLWVAVTVTPAEAVAMMLNVTCSLA